MLEIISMQLKDIILLLFIITFIWKVGAHNWCHKQPLLKIPYIDEVLVKTYISVLKCLISVNPLIYKWNISPIWAIRFAGRRKVVNSNSSRHSATQIIIYYIILSSCPNLKVEYLDTGLMEMKNANIKIYLF